MTGAMRPGAAKVRLSDSRGDSVAIGRARVRLKLAAFAYVNAQHGIDANISTSRVSVALLCENAIRYYETLIDGKVGTHNVQPERADRLKLAATAYTTARHGADSNVEICRAGMAVLCEAAIRYCEDLTGRKPSGVVDPTLALEDGY